MVALGRVGGEVSVGARQDAVRAKRLEACCDPEAQESLTEMVKSDDVTGVVTTPFIRPLLLKERLAGRALPLAIVKV